MFIYISVVPQTDGVDEVILCMKPALQVRSESFSSHASCKQERTGKSTEILTHMVTKHRYVFYYCIFTLFPSPAHVHLAIYLLSVFHLTHNGNLESCRKSLAAQSYPEEQ